MFIAPSYDGYSDIFFSELLNETRAAFRAVGAKGEGGSFCKHAQLLLL
jgi:hypothetical protein